MPAIDRTYHNFDLRIEKDATGAYSVSVAYSPVGETTAPVALHLPFTGPGLEQRIRAVTQAVNRPFRRLPGSPEEAEVQGFGSELFGAAFYDEVLGLYRSSVRQARTDGKGLRLRLRIGPPELASLPWEFLYDESGTGDFVCLSSHTPIVRYLEVQQSPDPLPISLPLRILGMVAAPSDLARLDIKFERERMETALSDLIAAGRVTLDWVLDGTWNSLQTALGRSVYHVFHFIGHGGFDATTREGLLAFVREQDGRRHLMPASPLARLLDDAPMLRLAFLNACEGAKADSHDVFSSTSATLVRRGIPGVLAMQYPITDQAAKVFSRRFYESIADGLPVDAAVSRARVAITSEDATSLEWGTPVLTMRSDGVLFKPEASMPVPPVMPRVAPPSAPEPVASAPADQAAQYRAARTLYANEQYAAALDQFRALQAAGFKPAVGRLETLISEIESNLDEQQRIQAKAEQSARCETVYAELQHEITTAKSPARKAELRDAFAQFTADCPEYGDPTGLAEKLATPSVPPAKPAPVPDQERLLAIMLDPARSPADRAKAGDDLNQFTDPRPGVIDFHFGADYWCKVPAGKFTMGSNSDNAYKKRPENIAYDYWIAKYPITYAQYKMFLDDPNGYRNKAWWNGLHADALHQRVEGKDVQNWKIANRPAENVSWYDAMAFCAWLESTLIPKLGVRQPGYVFRLPTEKEWEKAARGTDGRIYPYDNAFDPNKGNSYETGIGQTSAVGVFPTGVSPCGALDMSGNVWEWCITEYQSGDSNNLSNDEARTLRGGSWGDDSLSAQAVSRFDLDPRNRGSNLGIRGGLFRQF